MKDVMLNSWQRKIKHRGR